MSWVNRSLLVLTVLIGSACDSPQSLVITDVAIIDVEAGTTLPGKTVIVADGRITNIGDVENVRIPRGAIVVDGSGKFLLPGLWDMHVHTSSIPITEQVLLPLFIAHGVTGIRSMAADCFPSGEPDCVEGGLPGTLPTIYDVNDWRQALESGTLIGPRIIAGSYYVFGPGPDEESTPMNPGNAAHGQAHARLMHERGVDFIKIYDTVSRDTYFSLAEEANRLGIDFAGHVPVAVRASEASAAGQRSIEHLGGGNVGEECSANEEELRQRVVAEFASESPNLLPQKLEMVRSYDALKCGRLFDTFIANNTWIVPTLMISRLPAELGPGGWAGDSRMRHVPDPEEKYWTEWQEIYDADWGSAEESISYSLWVRDVVDEMNRAGVQFLAGSDAGDPGVFWGSGLHDELALLVSAGLSQAEALRAATLSPARFLEATDSLGTIEVGKLADLLLLNANPLDNIQNTRKIEAVITRGRFYNRAALDALLKEVEVTARKF